MYALIFIKLEKVPPTTGFSLKSRKTVRPLFCILKALFNQGYSYLYSQDSDYPQGIIFMKQSQNRNIVLSLYSKDYDVNSILLSDTDNYVVLILDDEKTTTDIINQFRNSLTNTVELTIANTRFKFYSVDLFNLDNYHDEKAVTFSFSYLTTEKA